MVNLIILQPGGDGGTMSEDTSDTYSTACWVCFLLPELKTFFEGGLKLKNAIIKLKNAIIKLINAISAA